MVAASQPEETTNTLIASGIVNVVGLTVSIIVVIIAEFVVISIKKVLTVKTTP